MTSPNAHDRRREASQPAADRRPMTFKRFMRKYLVGIIAILASIVVFIVPFAFIFLTAAKNPQEASLFEFTLAAAELAALGEPRRPCSRRATTSSCARSSTARS